jgi:dihydropteroate synthase
MTTLSVSKIPPLHKPEASTMYLQARDRTIQFPRRPLVMGILNINDDSFSGDGQLDPAWAVERAREMATEGADIIDAGAESARTNRPAISEIEEIARLSPFVERFSSIFDGLSPADSEQIFPPLLSINTWRPAVARHTLNLGGHILNDMSGLPTSENAAICAGHNSALLIMHSIGEPKMPHTHVRYPDVVAAVDVFFEEKIALARSAKLSSDNLILDPGIDFAKHRDDNLRLLRHLGSLTRFNRPILLPISRKTVIGDVLDLPNPLNRDAGSVACIVAGQLRGASIFRVHNLLAAVRAIRTVAGLAAT